MLSANVETKVKGSPIQGEKKGWFPKPDENYKIIMGSVGNPGETSTRWMKGEIAIHDFYKWRGSVLHNVTIYNSDGEILWGNWAGFVRSRIQEQVNRSIH